MASATDPYANDVEDLLASLFSDSSAAIETKAAAPRTLHDRVHGMVQDMHTRAPDRLSGAAWVSAVEELAAQAPRPPQAPDGHLPAAYRHAHDHAARIDAASGAAPIHMAVGPDAYRNFVQDGTGEDSIVHVKHRRLSDGANRQWIDGQPRDQVSLYVGLDPEHALLSPQPNSGSPLSTVGTPNTALLPTAGLVMWSADHELGHVVDFQGRSDRGPRHESPLEKAYASYTSECRADSYAAIWAGVRGDRDTMERMRESRAVETWGSKPGQGLGDDHCTVPVLKGAFALGEAMRAAGKTPETLAPAQVWEQAQSHAAQAQLNPLEFQQVGSVAKATGPDLGGISMMRPRSQEVVSEIAQAYIGGRTRQHQEALPREAWMQAMQTAYPEMAPALGKPHAVDTLLRRTRHVEVAAQGGDVHTRTLKSVFEAAEALGRQEQSIPLRQRARAAQLTLSEEGTVSPDKARKSGGR